MSGGARRVGRVAAVGLALLAAALAPAARAASGLTLGFNSNPGLTDTSPGNGFLIKRAAGEGAGIVRVNVDWRAVSPGPPPPGFVADDPTSPNYDWSPLDALVRALSRKGLRAMITISLAPYWAEGPHRPASVRPGTWEPDPAKLAQFATAAARRYDGTFPDPSDPAVPLPRVRYWQAWNEPNLDYYLTPQWTHVRHGFVPASPAMYRAMLNAFYVAVKRVSRLNTVVTAGLAPYGNAPGVSVPGGYRIQPVTFDRALFSAPVHCDAVAQHAYPLLGPLWHAYQPGDVSVPDLYKIARVMHAAARAGTLLPRGPKQLWVTELGWNSNPPDSSGVPVATQARWYEQALYVLWRQGVNTVLLLQIIDPHPLGPWEAGLFYSNGRPKPAETAFRFPFVTSRSSPSGVLAWGRAPAPGRLVIETRSGARWRPIAGLDVQRYQVFERTLALRGRAVLRARLGTEASLSWTQAG